MSWIVYFMLMVFTNKVIELKKKATSIQLTLKFKSIFNTSASLIPHFKIVYHLHKNDNFFFFL